MLGTQTSLCRPQRANSPRRALVAGAAPYLQTWEPIMTAAVHIVRREGASILFFALLFGLTFLF